MILTDREIQIALVHGMITIDPMPDESAYSSTSVDLTLDATLNEFTDIPEGIDRCIDPSSAGFHHDTVLNSITRRVAIDPERGHDFKPGTLILAWTRNT